MFMKKMLSLMAALLLIWVMICPVFAAEPVTADLPVTCKAEGIGETFIYTIEPLDTSQDFEIVRGKLSLKDGGSDMFRLRFTQPGIYSFRVIQAAGSDRAVQYDDSVFAVDFHVFLGENGELYTEIVAYVEGSSQKSGEVSFINTTAKDAAKKNVAAGDMAKNSTAAEGTAKDSAGETIYKSAKRSAGNVNTGDEQDSLLYLGLCAAAFLMILYIAIRERHRRTLVFMVMVLFLTPEAQVYAAPAEGATVSHSGTSRTTTWEIYSDGTLVIRPTNGTDGYMYRTQTYTDVPWYSYRNEITSVETQGTVHLGSDASYMFYDMSNPNLTSIDVSGFDVSEVENMRCMFSNCKATSIKGLSGWNTSSLEAVREMFCDCCAESLDLSGWNMTNVEYLQEVFSGAKAKTIDLTGWDVSGVKEMYGLFMEAEATTIKGLEDWDVSNTDFMREMFKDSKVTSLDLSKWNTSAVTNMDSMFSGCAAVSLGDISGWNTSNVLNISKMFFYANVTNLDISGWDVSNVLSSSKMFYRCKAVSLNLSGWDTSKAASMESMFYQASASEITIGAKFRFKGKGSAGYSEFNDPPSDSTTGKWIKADGSVPAQTADSLYNSYDDNAVEWAGKWIWEVKETSAVVNFDAQGGYTPQAQVKLSAAKPVTMPEAVRPAYALLEWNTAADGTGAAYQPGDSFTPEGGKLTVFYAQWEKAAQYTVRHYQQDVPQTGYDLVETESFYAPKNSSVRPPTKTYVGFNSPVQQTVTVAADNSTIVDYKYDRTSFTVHFEGNGATSGGVSDQLFIGGIVQRLNDNKFRKENAVFNGWNTKADGSGTPYGDAQTVINLAGEGEIFTLYAQWMDTGNAAHEPTSGKYTIKVRPGETVTIPELPAGTKYKITEKDIPDGWEESRAEGAEGVIGSNEISEAAVVNRYSASGTITIKAYKAMTNGEAEEGQFSFELLKGNSVVMTAVNSTIDTAEEVLAADGETTVKNPYYGLSVVNFENVPISSAGTHKFTIRETKGNDDGIEYDEHDETVTVNAVDNENGTLTCTAVYDSDGPVFVNSRIPTFENPEEKGNLVIQKEVSNLASSQLFPFTVNLYDEAGTELTQAYTCDIVETGHEEDYRTGGTYTVSAVSHTENLSSAGEKNSNYGGNWNNRNIRGTGRDSASSQAHVITLEGATELNVTIVYGGESYRYDWVCMWQGAHSDYTARNNINTSITKQLGGGNHTNVNNTKTYTVPGDTVTFSFKSDSSGYGDGYGYYAVVTAQICDLEYHEGFISSQELTSGSAVNISEGQSAVIREISAGASYKVTEGETAGYELVKSEGAEGTITADTVSEASFTNVYDGRGQAQIRMQKIFASGVFEGGEFTFRLLDEGGKLLDETTNDEGGGIAFGPIEYTVDDIGKRYRYTVEEVTGDDTNIVYDTHEEEVLVEVSDGGDGNLIADVQYLGSAVFTNRSTIGMIRVRKTLIGRDKADASDFTFAAQLKDSSSIPFTGSVEYRKGSESGILIPTSDGRIAFSLGGGDDLILKLPFGTKYTIAEVEANSEGYMTTTENAEGVIEEENAEVVFVNQVTKAQIKVRKIVGGNMGNRSAEFNFTAQFKDRSGAPLHSAVIYTKGEEDGTFTPDTDGKVMFALSDGEEITFELPIATEYTVTELQANTDGYLTTMDNAEGVVVDENPDIVFTNSRNVSIFTEGAEKVPGAVLFFPAAGLLLAATFYMRRKADKGEKNAKS